MLQYLKMQTNQTHTENGASTYRTSGSACLDLFGTIGALRHSDEKDIIARFSKAYQEDAELTMKILFFARDVRGGLGERRVFRIALMWLANNYPQSVLNNLNQIAEYGRYDDLLCLWDTVCSDKMITLVRKQLNKDIDAMQKQESVSLLAKWLPSVNASSASTVRMAKKLAKALGMNEAVYRKTLSSLRKHLQIIENNLREKNYTFDYAKQPSRAMLKYKEAFWRNDRERYQQYLNEVTEGNKTMHTGAVTPYDVISPIIDINRWMIRTNLSQEQRTSLDVTWNALEDFTDNENALVVVDGSGSMYSNNKGVPIAVALSLGIYFAEHNKGAFHNHFITFSRTPRLVEVKGNDITSKVQHCANYNEAANTDLQKVFDLILKTAVEYQLPQEDMPATVYIVSDMEFDECVGNHSVNNFEFAKQKYMTQGYQLPRVIFWNVASRRIQQPVTMHESGTALVSGCSPRIFSLLAKKQLNPYAYMMEILNSERYAVIAA